MKIVLSADLTPDSLAVLKKFVKTPYFETAAELHVIHCFEIKIYTDSFYASYFPTKEQFPEIENAVKDSLKTALHQELSRKPGPDVHYHCHLSNHDKKSLVDHSANLGADLIVVGTRSLTGIKGVFSTSFADYVIRHSSCPVLVLK